MLSALPSDNTLLFDITYNMSFEKIKIQHKPNQISVPKPKIKLVFKSKVPKSDQLVPTQNHLIDLKNYYMETKTKSQSSGKTLIIEVLNQLVEHTEKKIDQNVGKHKNTNQFKVNQFKRAIGSLQSCEFDITSGNQAKKLNGIGQGIAKRIDEILSTGTLAELSENITIDDKTKIINELKTVTGIGESRAQKLVEMGVLNISDLKNKVQSNQIKITHHIQIGLTYYEDFQQKVPYDEIVELSHTLRSSVSQIHPDLIVQVCGSHRRKKQLSGDIDVLMTNPNIRSDEDLVESKIHYLKDIVSHLKQIGFLVDDLTVNGDTKYMGVCKHQIIQVGRRIDIRFVTYDSYFPALLYFTGSMMTNKLMRTIALEKGYTLNEYGLYFYVNGQKGQKIIPSSEKHIFDILGIQYLEPEEREIN